MSKTSTNTSQDTLIKLGAKQELFAQLISQHIVWLYDQGYKVRCGDFFAHDRHMPESNHYYKLAADLNLFKDGEYLIETEDHLVSGQKWETRHPLCRWGGHYNDGNHYELRR